MFKQFTLSIFLLYCLTSIKAQDKVDFSPYYKPQTKYSITTIQSSVTEITYIASEEVLKALREKKIENPKITKSKTETESILVAGKISDSTYFPVTITFVRSNNSDGKTVIPDGTVIYGHSNGKFPAIDSIFSPQMQEEFKQTLRQSLQSAYSQLAIPEQKFMIGETYVQYTPLSFPIGGITIDMNINTTYTLKSIDKRKAYFDIKSDYTMTSKIMDIDVNASGNGKGELHYDTKAKGITLYTTEQTILMKMKYEKSDLELKSKSGFLQKIAAKKN